MKSLQGRSQLGVFIFIMSSLLFLNTAFANVMTSLSAEIQLPESGFSTDQYTDITLTAADSLKGSCGEVIKLSLKTSGIIKMKGRSEWTSNEMDKPLSVPVKVRTEGFGYGHLRLQAKSFKSWGESLCGAADDLFILRTKDDLLFGKSSDFELKRQKIERDHKKGILNQSQYDLENQHLLEGKELYFEREFKNVEIK